ncbi:nucleoside deaminase [Aestuariispira insulae]|uniref:tRNA(Arg) A34 adenosine deaminase TadA n=1 Tax=Aestuariispira insulae TaxID=1461337 RepID=A0A3D9HMV7_9PROT|nr:deaminase [Aestuariispira insulae]RED50799.1 tRNA(Arg) A34 adenosine deaminase TadA [Aestuariispira insulae]
MSNSYGEEMIKLTAATPVSELTEIWDIALTDTEVERHQIFMLLTLTLVYDNWCIYKNDARVLADYSQAAPGREFSEYVGHNIGALLVNQDNAIVTYAFNNNHLHNNSTEHAETRLIRKALRLYNRKNFKTGQGNSGYWKVLKGHTVYTSLESCSQCSGIMDLANVENVVYAQVDPGQGHIGNILYNLHRDEGGSGAPRPIKADFLPVFSQIEEAYSRFGRDGTAQGTRRPGATRFLRSVDAFEVFREAAVQLEGFTPTNDSNQAVLEHALEFRESYNDTTMRDAVFGE